MKKTLKSKRNYFLSLLVLICLPFFTSCGGVTPGANTPTINSFTADSYHIIPGESVTLSWTVTNSVTSSIDHGIGAVALSGSTSVSPTTTTTYTLTATNSSGPSSATVTITVGTGMADAIKLVVEDILPEIPEVQSGDPYVCLKLDSSLPPGTLITEDSLIDVKAALNITLEEEMYFFYLDLAPRSYYEHPVKYILVDTQGNHQIHDARWWPKINHVIPEIISAEVPEEKDIIASNIKLLKPVGMTPEPTIVAIPSQLREGFIVVQGLMPDEKLFGDATLTYLNGISFFNAYKSVFSRVEGLLQSNAKQVLNTIDAMADEDRGIITIYIIAHGGNNVISLGGQSFYTSQFRNKMAEYPGIIFNFILGSCHSGSFIDDLSSLDNVYVIETACASDGKAYGDFDQYDYTGTYISDINPEDIGSEWTSSLIKAMQLIVNNTDRMATVQALADNHGLPITSMLIYQAGRGALGENPTLGLNSNYDLTQVWGWTSPTNYCSVIPIHLP